MNRIILIGNLTRDPELRYTPSGVPVASFGIAVNRWTKNAQGEREVDFFNIVAWRQRAEFVSQYAAKGKKVAVEGNLRTRDYVGQDGVKRREYDIQADNIELLDSRQGGAPGMAGQVTDGPGMAGQVTDGQGTAGSDAPPAPPHGDVEDYADPFSEG